MGSHPTAATTCHKDDEPPRGERELGGRGLDERQEVRLGAVGGEGEGRAVEADGHLGAGRARESGIRRVQLSGRQ